MDTKPKESDNYLDIIHGECRKLRGIAEYLEGLAASFERTGNKYISDELVDIAFDISLSEREIHSAVDQDVHDRWKQSQEMSATIFRSVLAGIKLQKEEG